MNGTYKNIRVGNSKPNKFLLQTRTKGGLALSIIFFSLLLNLNAQDGNLRIYGRDSLGICRMYYENDSLELEGKSIEKRLFPYFWIHRVHDGVWVYYYKNGAIKRRETWNKGKRDGFFEYFNEQKQLMRIELYRNDKFIDERIYIEEIPLWEQEEFKNKKVPN